MDKLLSLLPTSMQGQHLRPWTPRHNGLSIVKLRWTNFVATASAQFSLAQKLQYNVEVQNKMKKVWVAAGRHPDNAKRRKALRDAAGDIKKWTNNNETAPHRGRQGRTRGQDRVAGAEKKAHQDVGLLALRRPQDEPWALVTVPISS